MSLIHVVPHGGERGWKHEGDDAVAVTYPTEKEAERAAKEHAHEHGDWEVVIHGKDGRIRDSDTIDRAHEGRPRHCPLTCPRAGYINCRRRSARSSP